MRLSAHTLELPLHLALHFDTFLAVDDSVMEYARQFELVTLRRACVENNFPISQQLLSNTLPLDTSHSSGPRSSLDCELGCELPQNQGMWATSLDDPGPLLPQDWTVLVFEEVLEVDGSGDVPLVEGSFVCLDILPALTIAKNNLLLLCLHILLAKSA